MIKNKILEINKNDQIYTSFSCTVQPSISVSEIFAMFSIDAMKVSRVKLESIVPKTVNLFHKIRLPSSYRWAKNFIQNKSHQIQTKKCLLFGKLKLSYQTIYLVPL